METGAGSNDDTRSSPLITFLGILTFQATAFAQATSETVEETV